LDEYHIEVQREEFIVNHNEIESTSDHLKLPKSCPVTQNHCETGVGTYIWETPPARCDLEVVTPFRPRKERSLLIDEENKILVNITRRAVLPNCGDREIYSTTYQDILVMKGRDPIPGVPQMDPADVRMDSMISSISAYVMYRSEERMDAIAASWKHQVCKERFSQEVNQPQRLTPELFGLRRGDVYYVFQCPKKTADVLEADRCWHDIPIMDQDQVFVDPVSRILKPHSAEVPCSKRLPLKIKTTSQWVELLPHLRRVQAPLEAFPEDQEASVHEDLHHAGIYTEQELRDWETIINFPAYRDAILSEVSLGYCTYKQGCSGSTTTVGVPSYNLEKLINSELESLDPWEQVKTWITQHGAYLSALVLILTLAQWSMYCILVTTALIREGPAQAMAIAGIIFCSAPQTYGRVQRRRVRLRQREAGELYPLQPPTAPS
jgi:hypothetical protein